MFRKMIIGALAAAAVGFGAQAATAGEPRFAPGEVPAGFHPPRADFDYVVLIRRHHGGWERYGRYETLHQARHVERRLEREGFCVRIEEVRDHRRW
jgi:hypothetical protein